MHVEELNGLENEMFRLLHLSFRIRVANDAVFMGASPLIPVANQASKEGFHIHAGSLKLAMAAPLCMAAA